MDSDRAVQLSGRIYIVVEVISDGQVVIVGLGVPLVWRYDGGVVSSHTTEEA